MKMTKFLYFLVPVLFLTSCNGDDDGGIIRTPPRELSEVVIEDDADIQAFLRTHFYNYEEFQTPPADFDFRIVIDTIAGENADKTPLIDQVGVGVGTLQSDQVSISASDFLLDGEENISHTYYYLIAREGAGASPTVGDSTFVRFKGTALIDDGSLMDFDEVAAGGVWFDLPIFQIPGRGDQRAFRGVGEGLQQLRGGGAIIDNPDGTFEIQDFGVGIVIFPSGLGTFDGFRAPIPQYTPLIFTLELLVVEQADHDNDGIPSFMEDVDGDGLLFNDNTDDDRDALGALISNYLDPDDDGDGIPTSDEIMVDSEGLITFLDTDNDQTPDYLDNDDDNDGRPTIEEILFNSDGTIDTPDSDGDGTPDYLDADS
ncbi:FKBP-type peptidyl-prolyl cis-trans isomerase [Spongiimicrobium salis]|uniref:FKBP-type peptidyl-prolyl cis-trans isomerase n=1 Tax=Spongiimicrobium salis TaxID=1667022 RepID=UPI00374CC2D2